MRNGDNPEKLKSSLNVLKKHRVIIVFFIPDSSDQYYVNLDLILDKCLSSLLQTVNLETTNITLINNCSKNSVEEVVNRYIKLIDKYVVYNENKGKVYAVINEARSVYEEFVTITDADILFFDGWEREVFNIFENHKKAGVVSPYPCPYTTFYLNKSVFSWNTIFKKIKYGKFVSDEDINLYVKGTNLPKIIDRNSKFNWKEKQFILMENVPAVIGAYHVVATYRSEQFRGEYTFPEKVFINSYEEKYIDSLADYSGLYRLSTVKSYIYHMGNLLDDISLNHKNNNSNKIQVKEFKNIKPYKNKLVFIIFLNRLLGGMFIKFKWKKYH